MTAGWQEVVYGAALVLFALAAFLVMFISPEMRRPWWKGLVALGLALITLVPLWNASSLR